MAQRGNNLDEIYVWTQSFTKFILLVEFHPSHFPIASSCTRVYSSPARCRLLPWARGYLFEEYPRPFTQTTTGWKGVVRFDGFSMVINWVFLVISFSPWTEASRWSKNGWQFVSHIVGAVACPWYDASVVVNLSVFVVAALRTELYGEDSMTRDTTRSLHQHCSIGTVLPSLPLWHSTSQ